MNDISLYFSSQLLHKQWFQKLGDPYDNESSRKNINHAGFKTAWEELIILTKFIDRNRHDRMNLPIAIPLPKVAKTASGSTDSNQRTVFDIEMQLKKCSVLAQSISDEPKSKFFTSTTTNIVFCSTYISYLQLKFALC